MPGEQKKSDVNSRQFFKNDIHSVQGYRVTRDRELQSKWHHCKQVDNATKTSVDPGSEHSGKKILGGTGNVILKRKLGIKLQ